MDLTMPVELRTDVLHLTGPLDARSTAAVRAEIYRLLDQGDLIVDLDDVDWVDAVALRMLATATRRSARQRRRLTLRGGSSGLRRSVHRSSLRRSLVWSCD